MRPTTPPSLVLALGLAAAQYLAVGCGGIEPAADTAALIDPAGGTCTDTAPGDSYTCGQQLGWGKCDEPWMQSACDRTCGRCPGIGNPLSVCSDVPPGGEHTCAQQAAWGKCGEPWMEGYCQLSCDRCPVSAQLIDPAASGRTRALMSYLVSIYRDAMLSGQNGRAEAEHMAALTGRHPAILGVDFMDYSPSRVARGATCDATDQAIEWSQVRGGIVTVVWHWNAPDGLVDSEEWPWWKGFYADGSTFDLGRAMGDPSSGEYQLILRDIDAIAAELRRLDDAGVPVLWRPIHEASGAWFWWGSHGPDPFIALWRLLYDRLVNHHQLHNLIWVWNGQHQDWYPGDQYVDVVGEDIYGGKRDYRPQEKAYVRASEYATMPKLVAMSETGVLPDPARVIPSAARWSWFMLWSGDYAMSDKWNEDAMKKKVYASDFVITLDELPPL